MVLMKVADPSRKARHDDSVMATNNSSIVSKRSVERIYYPEPHFFRYFVNKPQRRAPLINRGYWLRMHAVDQVIRQFLAEPSQKRKLVLNLGCGYDPLAFQWLSKNMSQCQNAIFIDVDYPQLMTRKVEVINSAPQLQVLLGHIRRDLNSEELLLRSEHYCAVGCDLTNTARLGKLLATEFDMSGCLVLCIAEVSITYMNVDAADSVIGWAALYGDVRFCLLEQYLPDGAYHPFAKKMIRHFDNLNTPLRSIHVYPGLKDQERRFLQAGWSSVTARSLWNVWCDDEFVTSKQRLDLNEMEAFDEWEEFVLFASHYFLLVAVKHSIPANSHSQHLENLSDIPQPIASVTLAVRQNTQFKTHPGRRYGAILPVSTEILGHNGGLGPQSRSNTTDLYDGSQNKNADIVDKQFSLLPGKLSSHPLPEARMCHTITSVGQRTSLLIGGRTSPNDALRDCWMWRGCWKRINDLPNSLFRHCAAQVTVDLGGSTSESVLVYGGKTSACHVSDKWLLWRESFGWVELADTTCKLTPRFGAVMISTGMETGVLLGGMAADGTILREIWDWTISSDDNGLSLKIDKRDITILRSEQLDIVTRFGACIESSPLGLILIGGVSNCLLTKTQEIIQISKMQDYESHWQIAAIDYDPVDSRPLLVGHSTLSVQGSIAVVGGGAVCFSFGTYWNTSPITLSSKEEHTLAILKPIIEGMQQSITKDKRNKSASKQFPFEVISVQRRQVRSASGFADILEIGRPIVMSSLNIGSCIIEWQSLDALKSKVGADREVVVHHATSDHMDFSQKNFSYIKKSFGTFLDEVSQGSRQYLRSLASTNPAGQPADIAVDFPQLASDFELPPQLGAVRRNMHSAVLRISGSVTMWLHYDVMANVLCQIRGSKRLLLYPPSDVSHFSLPPGASSSSMNCFDPDYTNFPSPELVHPHEVFLQPGDVLYIPPLWLHTASPTHGVSVSVNVFFRNLDAGYAPGKDVYGNRDVQAYEKGRQDVERITKSFDKLPLSMRGFYLDRLADEMKEKASERTKRG